MGGHNSNSFEPLRIFNLKAKADEQNDPHFQQRENVEGQGWKDTTQFDSISGIFVSAKIEERKFNDGIKNFFTFIMKDSEGKFKLSMSHNDVSYSMLSSIASCANTKDEFTISLWSQPSKDGNFINGRCKVLKSGEKTQWLVPPNEAPKKELITKKDGITPLLNSSGKKQYDDEDRRKYWESVFTTSIVGVIGETQMRENTSSGNQQGTSEATKQEDDLPF